MNDLPANWELFSLGELTKATRPICYGVLKPGPYVDGGVPLLRIQDLASNVVSTTRVHCISKALDKEFERSRLEGGEVLLSIQGTIGRAAIAPYALKGANISRTLAVIAPDDRLDRRLLFYYLQYLALVGGYETGGSTRASLNIGTIRSMVIPLPPAAEQAKVVAAVEQYLSRLDAAEAAVESAQLRVRALYQALLSRAQSEGEEVALDDLLVDIEAGKSFKTPGRPAHAAEWGVIKVSAMTWGEFDEDENKAIPAGRLADPRYEIRAGDLLLSRANTSEYVGATVLVGACRRRLLLSDKSMRLLTRDGVERRWLRFALGSTQLRSQMSALATGTSDSMRNISQTKVRGLRIRVPEAGRQKKIADEIEEALRARGLLEVELGAARRRATGLRRSILKAAFAGRLVAQDPDDEPAAVLLDRIRDERAAIIPTRRARTQAASQ